MTICTFHWIVTAVVAPLLLAIHWLGSKIRVPIKRSSFQVMMDSSSEIHRPDSLPLPERPCQPPYISTHPSHCDTTLSKKERVQYLITHLTNKEKISLLGHDSPSINRPGMYLPAYKWWNEGLHGMAWTDCCPPYEWENVTVFPQVIGLGMTFNRTLWSEVGGVIGTEAMHKVHSTTKSNGPHPGLTYFTPNINIFRDVRWGRGQETPGEDPYLTSHYAAVIVMSLQYGNEFLKQLNQQTDTPAAHAHSRDSLPQKPRIAATCKHFAGYSLETSRFNFSAEITDQRDWNDTYLPAFDACIHAGEFLHDYFGAIDRSSSTGGALGTMCSYNSINQIPACANPAFLQDRLRHEWSFPGYVVSDCWAISNIYEHHHYASSYSEAAGMALRAGVDLDCGDTVQGYGMEALEEGYMDINDVDRALTNLFGVLVDVGYFDYEEQAITKTAQVHGEDESQKEYHDQVALEAALQSIVLLKNGPDKSSPNQQPTRLLPLSNTKHRKTTLIGPLADDKNIMLGNYHGIPTNVITPKQGLEDLGIEVEYIQGCNVTDSPDGENDGLPDNELCEQMKANSDATILIVGPDQDIESEGLDRTSLLLPKVQRETIEEATRCSKAKSPSTPLILVVISGGPIDLSSYKSNNDIDAILYTSYPGQAGGQALAHVLYGKYNPSGRLVTTIYHNSYSDKVALYDMRMRPEESNTLDGHNKDLYPGRTYRFYTGSSVYPFGYGLSYSSWNYSVELATTKRVNSNQYDRNLVSVIAVNVSNTGSMDGSDSILLFHMGPDAGRNGKPIKSLIGFEKVYVLAGGTRLVEFNVEKWMMSQEAGTHTFRVGPSMDYSLEINTLDGGIMS